MNNSVFGKTMENIRKHRDINVVTNQDAYLKMVMKPHFKSGMRFSENLMDCKIGKIRVIMNKPIYLGQAILDLSKIIMYEFHDNYMFPRYDENLRLCYMDTNLLVYNITVDDFYKDIAGDIEVRLDMNGYSCSLPLPLGVNNKFIRLMKANLTERS